jgi:peptidylprolyl isomerase
LTQVARPVAFAALFMALAGGVCVAEDVAPSTVYSAADAAANPQEWRAVAPDRLMVFETTKGRILIEAFPEVAPNHVEQFTAIVRSGDYDGTIFHRVIDGFMAQGGDVAAAKGRPSGLPDIPGEFTFQRDPAVLPLDAYIGPADSAKHGYLNGFPMAGQPEFFAEMSATGTLESYIPHCRGVVSTARTDDPNSANSQFFLMRDHSPHLDRQYTAWGRVVSGEDVVLAIKSGDQRTNGRVIDPDTLVSAKIAADLPEADRPSVWVMRTDSEMFKSSLAAQGEADVCTLTSVPSAVAN